MWEHQEPWSNQTWARMTTLPLKAPLGACLPTGCPWLKSQVVPLQGSVQRGWGKAQGWVQPLVLGQEELGAMELPLSLEDSPHFPWLLLCLGIP